MKKTKFKTLYLCSGCGYQSTKWLGRCPGCNEWNTFTEEVVSERKVRPRPEKGSRNIMLLDEVATAKVTRKQSGLPEFDRLMGGGVVPGSVILMSGEPGIGKSTLLLQLAHLYSREEKVLYVSGEESEEQVKLRADRLHLKSRNLYILTETDIQLVQEHIKTLKPVITIIDSIQTMRHSELETLTGAVTQIRECTALLMQTAKEENTGLFLVGHITKEGAIAGPKILEHMVDVVLYMEGDKNLEYRIVKSNKNRYGSTFEIAVFEMSSAGLTEVKNPSSYFIDSAEKAMPGSSIVTVMEGTRPLLIELQSLVTPSNMPYPRRVSEGVDYNKILLIAAILEKLLGVKLNTQEIYIKVVGGLRIQEPAIDLGIAMAMLSSYRNTAIVPHTVFIGEIGLTGEIRPVPYMEQRLNEVRKLSFQRAVIPSANKKKLSKKYEGLEIMDMHYITDLYKVLPKGEGPS
ncbi:MAG: DNA repair protein RadA [bacterium]|nr:DNA repair protein RadA [bacterium]